MKRALDVALTLCAAPVALVLAAAVALAVRLALGRPVLFRQERAGLGGRPFSILKFRTMREGPGTDAERLGRFGRFLRATSLDELPELWNVLKGDMSLVGPRPLPTRYLPRYTPEEARPYFRRMRALFERLRLSVPTADTLSMGMSRDYPIAIEEGSTLVRVGTAIFGARTIQGGTVNG